MTTPKTLIDRDEVIQILKKYWPEIDKYHFQEIIQWVLSLPTESQWIDVKDRLPKKNWYYLVCFHKSLSSDWLTARVCEQFYKKRLNKFWNITWSNWWRPGDITHYQSLPLPPQQ